MSNQDYIIQTQNVNTAASLETNTDKPKTKVDPSISEGVNFKVKRGFENAPSALPFSISLSSDVVDFGVLSPTNPIIRTVDLGINNIPQYGYSVIAYEDHPLKKNDSSIPDTTCDNGQCNQENASLWTNVLTYGFGYRCDNLMSNDCDIAFTQPNFYKHFSDNSSAEYPQSIISGIGSGKSNAHLSYKVNISNNQAQGIYQNITTYIAVPNF